MKENPFDDAMAFDRLDELWSKGLTSQDPEAADFALELAVLQMLSQTAEPGKMPRDGRFREELLGKIRPKQQKYWPIFLAVAAALLLGFLGLRSNEHGTSLELSDQQVASALETQTRGEMVAYLDHTERLLMSIRDHEVACSDKTNDMGLERRMALDLLLKQKRFSSTLTDAKYRQARQLFSNLESILVDVKNLDPCTDPEDLEMINEHINHNRILGKLRLIAQEIQVS